MPADEGLDGQEADDNLSPRFRCAESTLYALLGEALPSLGWGFRSTPRKTLDAQSLTEVLLGCVSVPNCQGECISRMQVI